MERKERFQWKRGEKVGISIGSEVKISIETRKESRGLHNKVKGKSGRDFVIGSID